MSSKSSGGDDDSTGLRAPQKLNTPLLRCAVARKAAFAGCFRSDSAKLASGEPPGSPDAFSFSDFSFWGILNWNSRPVPGRWKLCGDDADDGVRAYARAGRERTRDASDSAPDSRRFRRVPSQARPESLRYSLPKPKRKPRKETDDGSRSLSHRTLQAPLKHRTRTLSRRKEASVAIRHGVHPLKSRKCCKQRA